MSSFERLSKDTEECLFNYIKSRICDAEEPEKSLLQQKLDVFFRNNITYNYRKGEKIQKKVTYDTFDELLALFNINLAIFYRFVANKELPDLKDDEKEVVLLCEQLPDNILSKLHTQMSRFVPEIFNNFGCTPSKKALMLVRNKYIFVQRSAKGIIAEDNSFYRAYQDYHCGSAIKFVDLPEVAIFVGLSLRQLIGLKKSTCYTRSITKENVFDAYVAMPRHQKKIFLEALRFLNHVEGRGERA